MTPYRRTAKKKTYKKKAYKPRSNWKSNIAKAAATGLAGYGLKLLKNKLGLNTETHWVDTLDTSTSISSTMTNITNPLVIPIGDTVNTRTGNGIRVTSWHFNIRIQANAAAIAGNFVRLILYNQKIVRGSALLPNDLMDSTTRVTSAYNMGDSVNSVGYNILYDKTVKLSPSGQDGDIVHLDYVWTPLNWHVEWTAGDTAGTLANVVQGVFRACIMTSEPTANTPNFWCDQRVKFVDN